MIQCSLLCVYSSLWFVDLVSVGLWFSSNFSMCFSDFPYGTLITSMLNSLILSERSLRLGSIFPPIFFLCSSVWKVCITMHLSLLTLYFAMSNMLLITWNNNFISDTVFFNSTKFHLVLYCIFHFFLHDSNFPWNLWAYLY